MNKVTCKLIISGALYAFLLAFSACTVGGEPVELNESVDFGSRSSGGNVTVSSSSKGMGGDSVIDEAVSRMEWADIPAMVLTKGGTSYSVNGFRMVTTEVTQYLYSKLMGSMPAQNNKGENYPVENVNWFQAALFCNVLSKQMGLDTAYVYRSVGEKSYLEDLYIDYSVKSVRLPTEFEWEVAAHGGTTSTYYWGTEVASTYAYYGQSKGPAEVAERTPNSYSLYDMAGNVAEWVNDWYGAFPTKESENYTGVLQGSARVVRGGGWNDPVKGCAPDMREKKDPLYASHALGFRVVYSKGF